MISVFPSTVSPRARRTSLWHTDRQPMLLLSCLMSSRLRPLKAQWELTCSKWLVNWIKCLLDSYRDILGASHFKLAKVVLFAWVLVYGHRLSQICSDNPRTCFVPATCTVLSCPPWLYMHMTYVFRINVICTLHWISMPTAFTHMHTCIELFNAVQIESTSLPFCVQHSFARIDILGITWYYLTLTFTEQVIRTWLYTSPSPT